MTVTNVANPAQVRCWSGERQTRPHPDADDQVFALAPGTYRVDVHRLFPHVRAADVGALPTGDHYVVVSELMPHKRIDDAIAAFNVLGLPLIVIGDGPDARRL